MERAFLTRAPKSNELDLFKKFLGSYRDGSGNNREDDGSSRADSRQIERCLAELLHGTTTENKSYYDFVIESNESGGIAVRGASIKSKEMPGLHKYPNKNLRAQLEISNSNAKDWELCKKYNLTEDDFRNHRSPEKFGEIILERQEAERETTEKNHTQNTNKFFFHKDCVFISVLYSPIDLNKERKWLISSFSIKFPPPKIWKFNKKSLIGYDEDGIKIYEWYALSGSQFKYYPKIESRINGTDLFLIPKPAVESLRAKSARLFGD